MIAFPNSRGLNVPTGADVAVALGKRSTVSRVDAIGPSRPPTQRWFAQGTELGEFTQLSGHWSGERPLRLSLLGRLQGTSGWGLGLGGGPGFLWQSGGGRFSRESSPGEKLSVPEGPGTSVLRQEHGGPSAEAFHTLPGKSVLYVISGGETPVRLTQATDVTSFVLLLLRTDFIGFSKNKWGDASNYSHLFDRYLPNVPL